MRYLRRWAALICGLPLWLVQAPNGFGQETRAKIRVAIADGDLRFSILNLFDQPVEDSQGLERSRYAN
jgi:hypothetical protein